MIHDYETIVTEFIVLNSQIPKISTRNHTYAYIIMILKLNWMPLGHPKKMFFQLAKCLLNSAFRSDREASTALASLIRNGGVVKVGMVGNTKKIYSRKLSYSKGYFRVISRFIL